MEQLDKKILGIYFDDSRVSLNTLAKRLKISKSTLNYRIKKMERDGTISRYIPIFNYPLLGFSHAFIILMRVKDHQDKDLNRVLESDQSIINSMSYAGSWDIMSLAIQSVPSASTVITKIKNALGDRIIGIECHKIELIKFYPLKIFDTAKQKEALAVMDFTEQSRPEVSTLDRGILTALAKDGNMSVLDIAKKVKRSPSVVLSRFRKIMTDGWVQQCRPLLKLDQMIWALKCTVASPTQSTLAKIDSFCEENKYVNSMSRIAGGSTVFLYFLCLDMSQFEEAFTAFKRDLGEHVSHVDLLYYRKEVLRDILPV